MFSSQTFAQVTKGDKLIVQITKDGKVITDTTFQLKEDQDPEAVKKVIAHILEGDIEMISGKEGHPRHMKVFVEADEDEDIEIIDEEDIEWVEKDADNVDVYIYKTDDGTKVVKKVTVKVDVEGNNGNEAAEPPQKEPPKPEKKKK